MAFPRSAPPHSSFRSTVTASTLRRPQFCNLIFAIYNLQFLSLKQLLLSLHPLLQQLPLLVDTQGGEQEAGAGDSEVDRAGHDPHRDGGAEQHGRVIGPE